MCIYDKSKIRQLFSCKGDFFKLVSLDRLITVTVLSNGSEVEEAQFYKFEWEDTRPIEMNPFPLHLFQ